MSGWEPDRNQFRNEEQVIYAKWPMTMSGYLPNGYTVNG